jgi:hypothetical protein
MNRKSSTLYAPPAARCSRLGLRQSQSQEIKTMMQEAGVIGPARIRVISGSPLKQGPKKAYSDTISRRSTGRSRADG